MRSRVEEGANGSVYFPFALSDLRPLRPTQFYLTKFPAGLIDVFPGLREAGGPVGLGIDPGRHEGGLAGVRVSQIWK